MAVAGFASAIVQFHMVDKVNAALPSERRFATIGWEWFKQQGLLRECRRLYPAGPLVRRLTIWNSLGFAAVAITAAVVMKSIIVALCFASFGALLMWLSWRTSRPS